MTASGRIVFSRMEEVIFGRPAAQAVADAAGMLSKIPGGINIRTLQTLEKISVEPSQKTLFVLPADLIENVKSVLGGHK